MTILTAEPTQAQLERIAAQDRLERACAELVRAFHAWEQLRERG